MYVPLLCTSFLLSPFSSSFCRPYLKSSEVSKTNKMRRTPLHEAARGNQGSCVGELLTHLRSLGGDINAVDENVRPCVRACVCE